MKSRTLNQTFLKGLTLSWIVLYGSTLIYAANLTVNRHNYFLFHLNTGPGRSTQALVVLSSVLGETQFMDTTSIISSTIDINATSADTALTLPPLFHPSPFRYEEGSTLGYRLNKASSVSIRVYDMRGNEVIRKNIEENERGGHVGYNYVPFNSDTLGSTKLPTGVYFYLVMHETDILGKGKFAILP